MSLVFAVSWCLGACSSEPSDNSSSGAGGGSSSSTSSTSSSSGGGGSSSSTSSTSSSSGGGSGPGNPTCQLACQTAADCVTVPNVPIFDQDNYQCSGGLCAYIGCTGDAECESTYPNLGFVCRTVYPATPPACAQSCQTVNDCPINPGFPLVDADNYQCTMGFCRYTGCNNDAECQMHYASPDYTCKTLVAGYPPTCVKTCQDPSMCVTGMPPAAFDADNYSCDKGHCEYIGCNDTAECQSSYPGMNYVCN